MYARFELDGHVIKTSGIEWIVGEKKNRRINQIPSEEILRPKHFSNAKDALVEFLKVTRGCDDPLSVALWAFMLRQTLATTMVPGTHIKTRRLAARISQQKLAAMARVDRSTVQRIEYGAQPRTDTYVRILNALEQLEGVFP